MKNGVFWSNKDFCVPADKLSKKKNNNKKFLLRQTSLKKNKEKVMFRVTPQ